MQITDSTQQALYEAVNTVANSYPPESRARWQKAASTFRVPYWDWAATIPAGESFFPDFFARVNVQMITTTSNGQWVERPNPLYTYRFNPLNPNGNDFANLRGTPVSILDPPSVTH